jgi:hypothetical protein
MKESEWMVNLRREINFLDGQLQVTLPSPAKPFVELVSTFPLSKIDLLNPQNFKISPTFTQLQHRSFHPLLISSLASFEILTINNIQDGKLHLYLKTRPPVTVEIRPTGHLLTRPLVLLQSSQMAFKDLC